jgi:hypothetical protein
MKQNARNRKEAASVRRAILLMSLVSGVLLLSACQQQPVNKQFSPSPTPIILVAPPTPDDWERLAQRPLTQQQLPPGTLCPISWGKQVSPDFGPALGDGPVYLAGFGQQGVLSFEKNARDAGSAHLKTAWIAPPGYQGPALVRGRQVDGPNAVSFGEGAYPASQLRLSEQNATPEPSGWLLLWLDYTRVAAPGCYVLQVDGLNFIEMIYFQVAP